MVHKKVEFKGATYWLHEVKGMGYNLSPLDHYTDDGELIANPFHDVSYAVVEGEDIVRYGKSIGKLSDLVDVK